MISSYHEIKKVIPLDKERKLFSALDAGNEHVFAEIKGQTVCIDCPFISNLFKLSFFKAFWLHKNEHIILKENYPRWFYLR